MGGAPEQLRAAEFSSLIFRLEFLDDFHLTEEALLRMRRDLRQAARSALDMEPGGRERLALLFEPPLSSDPVALRRFQRPGPPFVIHPPGCGFPHDFEMGDQLELPVLFWGNGRHLVEAFAKALRALGPVGFHRGQGLFDLVAVEAVASGGEKVRIWDEGQRIGRWVLPIQDALWWLEVQDDLAENVAMDFVTPARVMSQGRPLFRASFSQIFPFLLRRVTSMLFAHCDLEVVSDSSPLLASARQVEVLESTLAWRDWRVLGEGVKEQDLGGLAGSMILGAKSLGEVDWVLRLASLFNIGKGAAYGAGHFSLSGRSASR